jgi:energy-coupling factor transporter ATP-binding protein EcfA2
VAHTTSPPPAPRQPSSLRLALAPLRDSGSPELAEARPVIKGETLTVPRFVDQNEFLQDLTLERGEHVTVVGATKSGKTTLVIRWILPRRRYGVVLATKRRDPTLYPGLAALGYQMSSDPELDPELMPRMIFRPGLDLHDGRHRRPVKDAKALQREGFERVLTDVIEDGEWAVYGDEIRYIAKDLKLVEELEQLWLQGATELVTMIVSTQRPVAIPVVAFESAFHLFLFRTTDERNIERIAEFEAANKPLLKWLLPRLGDHEVLYIETRTGRMVRTKVRL